MRKPSLSEDTLLRMLVAAIAETIARLTMLRTAGQFEQAQQKIDQELEELLGLKADLARRLSDEKIIEMLTTNDILDVGRLYYVAELFRQEAEILNKQGQSAPAQSSQIRALNLFLEVGFAVENDFLEADDRIDELFEALYDHTPEETLFTLFDYYEQVGAFDRALAALDLMLKVTEKDPEMVAEKRSFYERLLEESDEDLEASGLTREGIERELYRSD